MPKLPGFLVDSVPRGYREGLVELVQIAAEASGKDLPEILLNAAEAHRRLGQTAVALNLFARTLALWKHDNGPTRKGWCAWGIGMCLRDCGSFRRGLAWLSTAAQIARSYADGRCAVWSLAQMAETWRMMGRRRESLPLHLEVLREFARIRDLKGVAWAYGGIGQILRMEGRLTEATGAFSAAEDVSGNTGDVIGLGWALRGRAEVAKERGDYDLSARLVGAALQHFESKQYVRGVAYSRKTLGDIESQRGSIPQAFASLRQALCGFVQAGDWRGHAFAELALGDAWLVAGDPGQARLRYSEGLRSLDALSVNDLGALGVHRPFPMNPALGRARIEAWSQASSRSK